ncbi:uncharacterized protein CXQ87_000199 [Candidozyma duobushaemuli]|nr:uncharacterized protein CXQ87_000199 [[Candida] duobushaemulonis]PVH17315.1 hypothetical protein CXQ87_000199 [[Candida] duobushaemulonis]
MPSNTEKKEFGPEDVPSQEDTQKLQESIRGILNPDGKNDTMDGYINNTFSYVQDMLNKVANAQDKDAASKEIADDIVSKFKGWADGQKQDREDRQNARLEAQGKEAQGKDDQGQDDQGISEKDA